MLLGGDSVFPLFYRIDRLRGVGLILKIQGLKRQGGLAISRLVGRALSGAQVAPSGAIPGAGSLKLDVFGLFNLIFTFLIGAQSRQEIGSFNGSPALDSIVNILGPTVPGWSNY